MKQRSKTASRGNRKMFPGGASFARWRPYCPSCATPQLPFTLPLPPPWNPPFQDLFTALSLPAVLSPLLFSLSFSLAVVRFSSLRSRVRFPRRSLWKLYVVNIACDAYLTGGLVRHRGEEWSFISHFGYIVRENLKIFQDQIFVPLLCLFSSFHSLLLRFHSARDLFAKYWTRADSSRVSHPRRYLYSIFRQRARLTWTRCRAQ